MSDPEFNRHVSVHLGKEWFVFAFEENSLVPTLPGAELNAAIDAIVARAQKVPGTVELSVETALTSDRILGAHVVASQRMTVIRRRLIDRGLDASRIAMSVL